MTSNSALNCLLPQQKNLSEGGLFAFLQALIPECAASTEDTRSNQQVLLWILLLLLWKLFSQNNCCRRHTRRYRRQRHTKTDTCPCHVCGMPALIYFTDAHKVKAAP